MTFIFIESVTSDVSYFCVCACVYVLNVQSFSINNSFPNFKVPCLQLAALWPNGCMDNHGIKGAIVRAKERRRALHNRNKVCL